ncbi:probable glycosyltransferase At5g25310 [Impatiens glandulifera]|uniref:probable glycosyltransferase At5g25310 n=1 Tax=Impatiens glandulifera TaxID=253017 RepID=UPI001FB10F70|nr:probable glycosyltransferase At5g25310 [Impatiens glandulifera]
MKMIMINGITASAITFLFVISVLIVRDHFISLLSSSSSNVGLAVQIVELQKRFIRSTPEEFRAISATDDSVSSPTLDVNLRNQSPVIEQLGMVERQLARARAAIRKAANARNVSMDYLDKNRIYRNPRAFYQSYMEMERRLKVYVYEEGEIPIVHDGPCKNIYTSEGRFIHEMELWKIGGKRFRTKDPRAAHVYFMPFSVTWMVKYLYKPLSYDMTPLKQFVSDYVRVISTKHPFWNATSGSDHFMLSCHDWGPHASQGHPQVYNNSIRVLCNANSSEGFNPLKDVSLPEINLYDGNISPKLAHPSPNNYTDRPILAFFAGGLHGPIRPIILHHWKSQTKPTIQVHEYLPNGSDYNSYLLRSKFCLCPSGYEVASPRIVEAIYAECIPVIISDHYVLPFSDVLNWKAFSIEVKVSEIPMMEEILMGVSEEKYLRLLKGLRAVRRHFVFNQPAKRFDVFHMILHSVWLRRLNVRLG